MKNSEKIFCTVGSISLFLIALLWSVDSSLIYIFLGFSLFFFYLGLQNTSFKFSSFERARVFDPDYSSMRNSSTRKERTGVANNKVGVLLINQKAFIVGAVVVGAVFMIVLLSVSLSGNDTNGNTDVNFFNDAETFYANGNFDDAYSNYKQALIQTPGNALAWNGLGNVALSTQKYDSALYFYTKALTYKPTLIEASYNIALVYYMQEKFAECIRRLEALIRDQPEYEQAYLLMGDAYYVQKQYQSAIPYYEIAYQKGIRTKELCHIMAFIYDDEGRTNKAIPLYKEALKYDSSAVEIYERLAELIPGEEGNEYRRLSTRQW